MEEINVKNLTFSYDGEHKILTNVSFSINKGSYTTIVGHNGSGKSTLAKLLVGLLEKDDGEINIHSFSLNEKNLKNIRSITCLVFQNPDNQFIGATVEDDIAFGLENKCIPQDDMRAIIDKFAFDVGMENYLLKEPMMLSGGQKQRVAIAGALALNPEIIIFDESTSMLDSKGKKEISNLIQQIRKNNPDLTIVSITHDIEEAYLSDQVIVLSNGKIVLNGKPDYVFSNKEILNSNRIDIPFIFDVQDKLRDIGINSYQKEVHLLAEEIWASK